MALKILLLNGPPRSGKDTLGNMLRERNLASGENRVILEKFAEPIKRHFAAAWCVSLEWIEANKDRPFMEGSTTTVRQMLIAYSENYLKPLLGKNIFGRLLCARIGADQSGILASIYAKTNTSDDVVVITDSGFSEEAREVIKAGYSVYLIRLHRKGCDFAGDSRSYLGDQDLPGLVASQDLYADDIRKLGVAADLLYDRHIKQ